MDKNYLKSNHITEVDLLATKNALLYTKILMDSSLEPERQKFGEALLDELSDAAKIDIIKLKISPARQFHKKLKTSAGWRIVSKQYGYYRPDSRYIYIYNRTAIQGKTLAAKTFLDTLLHEWLHHYDYKKLGLNSIHSSGFYKRLNNLKNKLGF
ncbi:MAG: hypothetical protein WC459_03260 [Patescibacteria group bacterium]